jgi:hypothetical protein
MKTRKIQPGIVAPAIQALLRVSPCLQANSGIVSAAQKVLGTVVDGEYGPETAALAQALLPTAPGACNPVPAWWRESVTARNKRK